jgi:crossover junction endodeoxyribonuclease RuvC
MPEAYPTNGGRSILNLEVGAHTATIPCVGITAQQFQALQERVRGGSRRSPKPISAVDNAFPARDLGTILGIDPSLRGTGYGVIKPGKPRPILLAQGTIVCPPAWPRSRCLFKIAETLRGIVRQYRPTACAIEGLFFAQNLQTALIMGEARGAAIVAAAEAGLDIFEVSPRKVKQAMVGYGGAQKLAVAKMVQRMLDLSEVPAPDAADALALALTLAHEGGRFSLSPPRKI